MRSKMFITTVVLTLIVSACAAPAAPTPPGAPTGAPAQPAAPAPAQLPAQPAATSPDALSGTAWQMITLNGQPALAEAGVTIAFAAGRVAGSDGCNTYSGTYTIDGTNMQFNQPFRSTMMMCAQPVMAQAQVYLAALGQVASFQIAGSQLTFLDANGKEVVMYAAQSTDLAGSAWIVTGYNNGQQAVVSVMTGTELTANFGADGNLSGNGGCNTYTASYTVDGNKISIGPAATTRMACEQAVMDQEQQYLAALATAATYQMSGDKLELRTADGALAATFTKAPEGRAALQGAWLVTGYNNGKGGVSSVMAGTELTANFGADGALTGNAGCNTYNASYTVDGNKISIGPAATTMMACDQAIMDQEQQYLAALASAAAYQVDGSKLELRTADGTLAATFVKAPEGSAALPGQWTVTGYNNGKGGVVSVMAGTELTANFGADGNLSGSAGCNTYNASYTVDGDKISIGPAATTMMACDQAIMDQEQQYLTALSTAATYRVDGSKLELRTADGALAVSFVKAGQ
jgi:heat shock protein HslJ